MGGRCLLFRTASIGESWVEAPSSNGAFVAKREEGRRCEGGRKGEKEGVGRFLLFTFFHEFLVVLFFCLVSLITYCSYGEEEEEGEEEDEEEDEEEEEEEEEEEDRRSRHRTITACLLLCTTVGTHGLLSLITYSLEHQKNGL